MKVSAIVNIALAASPVVLASATNRFFRRDAGTCNIQLASSNGGRKVAIVLDSSGSMSTNDPNKLRVVAGKALNNQLVPASGAGSGKKSDLVTVVDFDDTAKVIYPLGDPAGAVSSFDKIDANGGTFIADGVAKAVAELTKAGNDPTADRSGIVVLTDGEDSNVKKLITEVENAGKAGIRVSFGFLAAPNTFFQPDLLSAILKTGGSYAAFKNAASIQPFLFLILSNGLTASDVSASSEQPLLSGLTIAKLSGTKPVAFTYAAQGGESLVFNVESLSKQALDAELKDGAGASLGKNSTTKGATTIKYTAGSAGDIKLYVSSTNSTAEGVFQVSLTSSLGISGCNLTTVPNGPSPNTSTTATGGPSGPTSTGPPVTTVTAAAAKVAFPALGLLLAALAL